MNKNIFIGCAFPSSYDSFFKEKGKDNFSQVVFNETVVEKMLENNQLDYVYGVGDVGHYPMFSKTFKMKTIKVNDKHTLLGYNNLVGLNVYSKSNHIYRLFKKQYSKKETFNIIVSEASISFLRAASKIKKRNKGSKITLILFDLPEFVEGTKKSGLYSFLKKKSNKKMKKYYEDVDSFVYLAEKMKEATGNIDKPYIVFPGIVNLDTYKGLEKTKSKTIDIVYSGTISKQFDIDFLVEAFKKTKRDDLRLILVGGGEGVNYVKEEANKDKRIEYRGVVSRVDALQIQLNATYLVNPRLPNHNFSEYSFPSKTMNYLLTLNPFISFATKAFPNDIASLLIEPESYEVNSLTKIFDKLENNPMVDKDKVLSILGNYTVDSFVSKLLEMVNKQ